MGRSRRDAARLLPLCPLWTIFCYAAKHWLLHQGRGKNHERPSTPFEHILDEHFRYTNHPMSNKEIIVGPFSLQAIAGFEQIVIRYTTHRNHTPVMLDGPTHVRFGNFFGLARP